MESVWPLLQHKPILNVVRVVVMGGGGRQGKGEEGAALKQQPIKDWSWRRRRMGFGRRL